MPNEKYNSINLSSLNLSNTKTSSTKRFKEVWLPQSHHLAFERFSDDPHFRNMIVFSLLLLPT